MAAGRCCAVEFALLLLALLFGGTCWCGGVLWGCSGRRQLGVPLRGVLGCLQEVGEQLLAVDS